MGRKIPGRKHKGINDPLKQQAERFNKIKDKINAPPTDADEQYIPKSLKAIIDLRKKVKDGKIAVKIKKKKRKSGDKLVKIEQPAHQRKNDPKDTEKPVPAFKQNPGESDEYFMHRVSRMCHTFLKEAAFENKYKVNVKRNPETGAVEDLVKRPKVLKTEKPKAKGDKSEPKLTKSQRRQLKIKEKKRLKMESKEPTEWPQKDVVKFGDIVHQPPTLNVPRRVARNETSRPGKRSLLLQSVMGKESPTIKDKVIDKTSKRKALPQGVRMQLEKHRDEVVNAYKLLKANKEKRNT